jgi:ABC-type uncharacterized transport system ATPase subunit
MPLNDLLEQAMERAIFSDENRVFQPHLQPGPGNVAMIVGPNASGKSVLFQVLAMLARQEKIVPVTVSIRERTGAGTSDIAGMRRMFMFGDESEQSTGATSLKTVSKAFDSIQAYAEEGRRALLLLDEPEQGLSEDYAAAMGTWLGSKANALTHPNLLGLVVVSHSRSLMRSLREALPVAPSFVSMEVPTTLEQWLEPPTPKTVDELLALPTVGSERRHKVYGFTRSR